MNRIEPRHSTYDFAQVRRILGAYRALFPVDEITPALRSYWGWDRPADRPWSHLTTDFHAATPEKLLALHEASLDIERRSRAGELSKAQKGRELVAASVAHGVGFSIGVNPWTDNLLLRTFDADALQRPRRLVVVVGHDWYPVGAGQDPESPMLDQGLHRTTKYHGSCPEAFFATGEDRPAVFFLNLYPDFRTPDEGKVGPMKGMALGYEKCVEGLREVLRILAPKFGRVDVISWGGQVWDHMRPHAQPAVGKIGVKKNALANAGKLLTFAGHRYLPISHPSMPNQVPHHLSGGFLAMDLGRPMAKRG